MIKIKVLRAILLLLSTVSMTGCFKQDYSICPPERNVKLDFRLIGEDVFAEHVSSVDAYIYDGAGNYLLSERLEQSHLEEFEGMYLALDPGDYRIVFWANLSENSEVSGHESGSGQIVHAGNRYDGQGNVAGNGDRLWYGPSSEATRTSRGIPQEHYALTIPEEGDFNDVIHFTHAHRSLEIYVEGLTYLPTLDVEGLPTGLQHMGMGILEQTVTASQQTSPVDKDGTNYAATTFDTFYFEDMEGIDIVIRNPEGEEIYRISLAEAVALSEADPYGRVISLVFTFLSGTVRVTMPGWESNHPGFEL